jgi:dihydropteroate synthase
MERFTIALPGGGELWLGDRPLVMGILNVTPDSFSDGGRYLDSEAAAARGMAMVEEGADLIDVGGESTRPGAAPVSPAEETERVLPVIRSLAAATKVPLSIDTRHGETAGAALAAGAKILNDVTGLRDPAAAAAAKDAGAAVVLMHMRGTPADMKERAVYDDVAGEVMAELEESIARAASAGIDRSRIILDPGIGFAKNAEQSIELIRALPRLAGLGRPLLVGASRKSFLTAIEDGPPTDRLFLSLGAAVGCALRGAHILRVHDVRATVQVLRTIELLTDMAGAPPHR